MAVSEKTRFFHSSLENFSNKYLYLLHVGWEKCQSGYRYANYRDVYLIHFIKSGCGTLNIDGSVYNLSQNDVFLIRPNQLAVYMADLEMPWEYYYFAFNGELAEELIEHTYFKNNRFIYTLKDNVLAQMIKDAALGIETCDIPDMYGLENLFRFLSQLTAPPHVETDTSDALSDSSQKYLKMAQEYVQANYFKPIQVGDICSALNVSRSYLFRIFKKYTHSDITNYLTAIRLQHAKELLRTTTHSSTNIARLVGYVNPTSFYRMFKKYEHLTPSEYRSIHQQLIGQNLNGSIHESSYEEQAND